MTSRILKQRKNGQFKAALATILTAACAFTGAIGYGALQRSDQPATLTSAAALDLAGDGISIQALAPENLGPAPGPDGRFFMDAGNTHINVNYGGMAYNLPLNPPGPQASMVRWVGGMGVAPQDAYTGTVYVAGHSWAKQPLAFNPFSEPASYAANFAAPQSVPSTDGHPVYRYPANIFNGGVIRMVAPNGAQRVWRITNTFLVDKNAAIADRDLMNSRIPGRIVLIACAVRDHRDLNFNVVVEGYLA